MTLIDKVKNFAFWPEIYVYPTNRSYADLQQFQLSDVQFSHDINLYIHIPFCKQLCAYCGYLKIVTRDTGFIDSYVQTVIKEIEMYKEILATKVIKTLHFGGGTPSLLSVSHIEQLIQCIQTINPRLFETAEEISIESTPETVTYEHFSALKQLGINRVSIGLQSMNDLEITLCNRQNLSHISVEALQTLKKIGFKNIVVDLMIGIEGQTVESFSDSVDQLLAYRPDTVELYALGIMPNTRIKNIPKGLMSNQDIYTCYEIGRAKFLAAGYLQDCHNRYALKGSGGFLQEDYVFQDMSVIGFGAGARSYGLNMHYRNNYSHSHRQSILEYIDDVAKNILPVKMGIAISPEEKMRQYAIYHIEHVDRSDFLQRFGIAFEEQFPSLYQQLLTLDFIEEDESYISLNQKGLLFRDLIGSEFFSKEFYMFEIDYRTGAKK